MVTKTNVSVSEENWMSSIKLKTVQKQINVAKELGMCTNTVHGWLKAEIKLLNSLQAMNEAPTLGR